VDRDSCELGSRIGDYQFKAALLKTIQRVIGGVLCVPGAVSQKAAQMELSSRVLADGGSDLSHLQGVVGHGIEKERAG
jgi:hypothetical protein